MVPDREPVNAGPAKPDLEDGFTSVRIIEEYTRAAWPLFAASPSVPASRFNIILACEDRPKDQARKAARAFLALARGSLRIRSRRHAALPRADILLFHSSRKPNVQPALDLLAERLAGRGFACAMIGPDGLSLWTRERRASPDPIPLRAGAGLSIHSLLLLPALAIVDALRIAFRMPSGSRLRGLVASKAVSVAAQLLDSRIRLRTAESLLSAIRPRVLLTNGDHLDFAAELLLAARGRAIHRINFFNELPLPAFRPFLSDEIFAWNRTVADTLRESREYGERIAYTTIGRAEIDFVIPPEDPAVGRRLRETAGNRKLLIFLTEYDANPVWGTEAITREAVRWLAYVAERSPGWVVVYKTRPNHHGKPVPGREYAQGLANFIVPDEEIPFGTLLAWPGTAAVAALSSTGLSVAPGVGKSAFRLHISSRQLPLPPLDEVCRAARSPEELLEGLRELDAGRPVSSHDPDRSFPWRGETVARMESICLERLAGRYPEPDGAIPG